MAAALSAAGVSSGRLIIEKLREAHPADPNATIAISKPAGAFTVRAPATHSRAVFSCLPSRRAAAVSIRPA
jgi:hypothetical protein